MGFLWFFVLCSGANGPPFDVTLRKGKSSLTFRKNPIRIISFELFLLSKLTVFDRESAYPSTPYSNKFFQGNMFMDPPKLLAPDSLPFGRPSLKKFWWRLWDENPRRTNLLSNSPNCSTRFSPGYEGTEKMFYFLNSSQTANWNSLKLRRLHLISNGRPWLNFTTKIVFIFFS